MNKELLAKVEEARLKSLEDIKTKAEESILQAKLSLYTSESYVAAQAKVARLTATADKLKETTAVCEQIVSEMPVYNEKTRENRKFNATRIYGYGNQIANLTGLISGIRYSASAHKAQMLAYTGLDEDTIDTFIDAFGSPKYYNKNYAEVVEETPADLDTILELLPVMEATLDVIIDKSGLTQKAIDKKFELARLRATKDQAEDQIALDLGLETVEA